MWISYSHYHLLLVAINHRRRIIFQINNQIYMKRHWSTWILFITTQDSDTIPNWSPYTRNQIKCHSKPNQRMDEANPNRITWKFSRIEEKTEDYLIRCVEFVVHEASDDAGFADGLIAEEHQLVFGQRWHGRHWIGTSLTLSLSLSLRLRRPDLNQIWRSFLKWRRERKRDAGLISIDLVFRLREETANLSTTTASQMGALKYAPLFLGTPTFSYTTNVYLLFFLFTPYSSQQCLSLSPRRNAHSFF